MGIFTNLVTWIGYSAKNEQSEDGAYYNDKGEFWLSKTNGSRVVKEDGTSTKDEERATELQNKWQLPDVLMYGMDAEEFLDNSTENED